MDAALEYSVEREDDLDLSQCDESIDTLQPQVDQCALYGDNEQGCMKITTVSLHTGPYIRPQAWSLCDAFFSPSSYSCHTIKNFLMQPLLRCSLEGDE